MQLIVVGAGPIGASLMGLALADGHDVTLIEADAATADAMAQRFDARVLHASIAEGAILEEAGAGSAGALVATTGDDSDNLMAMVLGLQEEIGTLVTVVNDRHHRSLFERLGVHVLLDPEEIVAQHLYGTLCRPEVEDSVSVPGGGLAFELVVGEDAPLAGRSLVDARKEGLLASELVVLQLRRRDEEQGRHPGDDVQLASGDRVTVFSPRPLETEQLAAFGSQRGS